MLHVINNLTSRELFFQLGQDSHSGGGSNFSVQFQAGYFSSAVIKSLLLSDSRGLPSPVIFLIQMKA